MTINKVYRMWYRKPAPCRYDMLDFDLRAREPLNDGWNRWSLPIGNGYMGVCTFGRTTTERLQVTEHTLFNPQIGPGGGLMNFAEVFIDIGHQTVENYRRELVLNDGIAAVKYDCDGVTYRRECFISYPDNVFAMKLSASARGAVSFTLRPTVPFVRKGCMRPDDGCGREGSVAACGNRIILQSVLTYYQVQHEGIFDVLPQGGRIETDEVAGTVSVVGADSAVILMVIGTNYVLNEKPFLETDRLKKLANNPHPHAALVERMEAAERYSYDELRARHLADFHDLFDRVSFDIGGVEPAIPTDELLTNYHYRDHNPYLEELAFHHGRYLMISSGRPGSMPMGLSGIWSRGAGANCAGAYFHNVNEQMNYWPVFTMNMPELFEGYVAYSRYYTLLAKRNADAYIAQWFPEKLEPAGQNGWIHGSNMTPYYVEPLSHIAGRPVSHSGPGMGGLTALMFWDYYDYTRDETLLREIVFPMLSSMSHFLSKVVEPYGDKLLVKYSASPEQIAYEYMTTDRPGDKCREFPFGFPSTIPEENRGYSQMGFGHTYYNTTGCSFDQQMVYEVHAATVRAAERLGIDNDIVRTAREQLPRLDPTPIGTSGQIKEFREEEAYGEIGDPNHRHISQLHGLLPGTQCFDTEEKRRAAERTLELRGVEEDMDGGILYGFATAFRICTWAKVGNGERAYRSLSNLLEKQSFPNLMTRVWEIDTQTGTTYGIGDMLVQNRQDTIHLLAALPAPWKDGEIKGIVARGNFVIDLAWKDRAPVSTTVLSKVGGRCRIATDAFSRVWSNGVEQPVVCENGTLTFDTVAGATYELR